VSLFASRHRDQRTQHTTQPPPPLRHCEEQSDAAIQNNSATGLPRFARNDEGVKAGCFHFFDSRQTTVTVTSWMEPSIKRRVGSLLLPLRACSSVSPWPKFQIRRLRQSISRRDMIVPYWLSCRVIASICLFGNRDQRSSRYWPVGCDGTSNATPSFVGGRDFPIISSSEDEAEYCALCPQPEATRATLISEK
jgi:hypothetical protein